MGGPEKECLDCGWQGLTADLDEHPDADGDRKVVFCPECGGTNIADISSDS